jgi:flagellar biosynthesis protein FlhB
MIQLLIYTIKSPNLVELTDSLSLAITVLAVVFKTLNFLIKIQAILKSVETLKKLLELSAPKDKMDNRKMLRSQVQFGYKVFKVFLATALFSTLSAFLTPILSHRLAFKLWFPFGTDTEGSEIGFWVASVWLMFNSPFLCSLDAVLDILPVIFMTFGIGLIDELSERLEKISQLKDSNIDNHKELKNCIEIHTKICEFVVEIKENFSAAILIQGILSAAILCGSVFTMSVVSC